MIKVAMLVSLAAYKILSLPVGGIKKPPEN